MVKKCERRFIEFVNRLIINYELFIAKIERIIIK